jgi:uncharacterized membrane protein YqhA
LICAHETKTLVAQTVIHIVFLLSALAIAYADRIMAATLHAGQDKH